MNISGQAFDVLGSLLNLLADPKAYEEQLLILRKSINENKKYVELIAPAGEISNMLEKQRANMALSEAALAKAKEQAQEIANSAKQKYENAIADANRDSIAIIEGAKKLQSDAAKAMKDALSKKDEIDKATKAAKAHEEETKKLADARKQVDVKLANVEKLQKEVEALRAELAGKLNKLLEL